MKFLVWLSRDCVTLKEVTDSIMRVGNELAVLLVQDGVYLADRGCPHSGELRELGAKVYASRTHVEERGISDRLVTDVELVGYPEIVDLIMEEYDRVVSM